jgi:hypothetical protein
LEYLGAFRLPRGQNGNPDGFSFGGSAISYDPADNSLFVVTKDSSVGKVSIPNPVKSANIEALPFASILQNIRDPLEGGRSVLEGSTVRGLQVVGSKLYGTAYIYYDANNSARVSHFSRSTDLGATSATPLKALWIPEKSGFVSGWMTRVPSEWQEALGGEILSGNCCVPIVTRTSFGPSAFSWKTSDFSLNPIPATPLLYYPSDHTTLGPWDGTNEIFGGTTMIGGMVIPNGTRSLLYFGSNGTGTWCYGTGGTAGECIDPLSSDKGQHAYPYNHQVWAYDLNDLAAVKSGTKQPWEVTPYATWNLDDFPVIAVYGVSGATYDASNKILYVSQLRADTDGYSSRALIHAYRVNTAVAVPYATPYSTPYSSPYATPVETVVSGSIIPSEVGGDEASEPQTAALLGTNSGGGAVTGTELAEETRQNLIINIMIQLITLLTQLIIQLKTQAALVLSAISNWGL